MTEPVFWRVHVPARRVDVAAITQEIHDVLAGLRRPSDTPSHWVPMHGDFAPWNLRHGVVTRSDPPVLLDWEDATWGPPRADAVRYLATSAALGNQRVAWRQADDEARAYWLDRLASVEIEAREEAFSSSLRRVLRDGGRRRGDRTA